MSKDDNQIEINGMAHVILTVSQFDKARHFLQRSFTTVWHVISP